MRRRLLPGGCGGLARRDSKWVARWRDPKGKSCGKVFERQVDAQQHLTSIENSKPTKTYVDPQAGKTTFEVFGEEWAAAQDWKATSRESWTNMRGRLIPLLGDVALEDIRLQVVRQTLAERYARSTTTTTMSDVGSIMWAAYIGRRIGADPTRG